MRESAIQQTPTSSQAGLDVAATGSNRSPGSNAINTNALSPFNPQPGKKSRHVLKEGLFLLIVEMALFVY